MLHIVVFCFRAYMYAPIICTAGHVYHKKELHGFLFLCMHVVLFLYLWSCAWQPFRPLELRH